MAVQTAEKFLELLARDPQLQTHQRLNEAFTIPRLTQFARGKGFIFSQGDLHKACTLFQQQRAQRS